jgi:CxxC-x17-CxxC domain-containing protein
MIKDDEWGEFFPIEMSPFAYNESLAQDLKPLDKESAVKANLKWKDTDAKEYFPQTYKVPEIIKDVPSSIVNEILSCKKCRKNYKIISSELEFYRKQKIEVPDTCPDCRLEYRLTLRNPRKLFSRKCAKCSAEIQTTFAPDRPEIVYCEKCYLKEVY